MAIINHILRPFYRWFNPFVIKLLGGKMGGVQV